MNKKYILFDLDGTLTNPREGITKSVQYALHSFGIEANDLDSLLCFIGPPLQESFCKYYGMRQDDAMKAVLKYRERFGKIGLFENESYEGIHAVLQSLKDSGKVLAVATSKPEVYTNQILDKYELTKYFDIICGSELDGRRSIKAEVIEEVFNRLGYPDDEEHREQLAKIKEQSIMVGDRRHDIIGANTCMIESIGVRFGYAESDELEEAGADYIVETVEELGELLNN